MQRLPHRGIRRMPELHDVIFLVFLVTNSDVYGSQLVKTYGAVIRFYAPAPPGLDPTQDDFAKTVMGEGTAQTSAAVKRLWVPMAICLTTNLPIIGIMEAMLLRLCEELVSRLDAASGKHANVRGFHEAFANLRVNFFY